MGIYSDDKFDCEEDSYCQMKCITNQFDNPVARLVIDYFITHSSQYAFAYIIKNPCLEATQRLLQSRYSTFVDAVKHSEKKVLLTPRNPELNFKKNI
jgi:hypothetical protein